MNIKWESIAFRNIDGERTASVWQFEFKNIKVLVHRYIHCDNDRWLLSITDLCIINDILTNVNIDFAKSEAINKAIKHINIKQYELNDCIVALELLKTKGENNK